MSSVQVGEFCYGTPEAAAVAACASYPMRFGSSNTGVTSVECSGVTTDNLLIIKSGYQSLPCNGPGCTWSYVTATVSPTYYPCWYGDMVSAGLLIVGAVILAWAPAYGLYRIHKLFKSGRGEE